MTYTVHHGDCLDVLATLPDDSIDAIVTDPPYGLRFMGKHWDYDVPGVDVWREALRVLKPGGHLLSFGGTRTYHRMAVNIEDAGFEIRDQLQWIFGSGFPKSRNLDGEYDGFGTALKPANEPICMARKPLHGTVAANVLAWGTGAINVDGCRVGTSDERPLRLSNRRNGNNTYGEGLQGSYNAGNTSTGRWPANVIHDGSEEVVGLFPVTTSGSVKAGTRYPGGNVYGAPSGVTKADTYGDTGSAARFLYCAKASKAERDAGLEGLEKRVASIGNLESAGRDGSNPNNAYGTGSKRRIEQGLSPTVPRSNHHPTVKPVSLMRYLCRLITPPGGTVLDPFAGSGSTGVAAIAEGFRFVGIERDDEYIDIARLRIGNAMADVAFGLFAEVGQEGNYD